MLMEITEHEAAELQPVSCVCAASSFTPVSNVMAGRPAVEGHTAIKQQRDRTHRDTHTGTHTHTVSFTLMKMCLIFFSSVTS